MKVIAAVKEETGYKLGPQDFLIGTLEQLADKFSDQFPAGEEGALATPPANSVETAKTTSPDPCSETHTVATTPAVEPKSDSSVDEEAESGETSILKTLRGFWER